MKFEIIGIIASIIILCSAIFKSIDIKKNLWMRIINSIGSFIFSIYGFINRSWGITILNAVMVVVCVVHIILLLKQINKIKNKKRSRNFEIDEVRCWANRSDDPELSHIKYGVFGIDWIGSPGWGRIELILDAEGIAHIESECMDKPEDKAFTKAVLNKVIDEAIVEE